MALKELIENQTIKIDDHKRGNRETKTGIMHVVIFTLIKQRISRLTGKGKKSE